MMPNADSKAVSRTIVLGVGVFTFLALIGLVLTDGVFVYPLDDPYIHLSMAEQMAAGGYGINTGEYASADSSILFPVLLMPFSGTAFHAYLPFIYNALGLVLALGVLAKIILESGLGAGRLRLAMLVFAPIALNFQGLALLGMEHMLHVDTVLMALLGLMRWLKTNRINGMLVLAILLCPLLRYEGAGLSLMLCAILFFYGNKLVGMVLAAAVIAPHIAFGLWLRSLGLSVLPNSVLAKSPFIQADENALWSMLSQNFGEVGNPPFAILFLVLGIALLATAAWKGKDRRVRAVALVAAAVALGHAVLGKFGWSNRYEIYALTYVSLSILVVVAHVMARGRLVQAAPVLALIAGIGFYGNITVLNAINGPANIYNQQWQMARLARAWGAPVLVHDIGLLSYRNKNKVVDLYGLASSEALEARRNLAQAGWPNRMASEENADLAMVYDYWFKQHLAEGWVRVGFLDLEVPIPIMPTRVSIYATRPKIADQIRQRLQVFSKTLPRFAHLSIIGSESGSPIEEGR